MADVHILFANKRRRLVFDIDAMMALEAATGKNTSAILADLSVVSFGTLVLALWAGLKGDDPKLTPKVVKQQLDNYLRMPDADLKALRKAVADAVEGSVWYQQLNADASDEAAPDEDGEDDEGNRFPARVG